MPGYSFGCANGCIPPKNQAFLSLIGISSLCKNAMLSRDSRNGGHAVAARHRREPAAGEREH